MKLHLCGGIAAMILLSGCGQMGPLVLPPKEVVAPRKVHEPVTVQPPVAMPQGSGNESASGTNTTSPLPGLNQVLTSPAEPKKGTP